MSVIGRHQRAALDDPCFLAGETMKPKYGRTVGPRSVIVTVNAGYE